MVPLNVLTLTLVVGVLVWILLESVEGQNCDSSDYYCDDSESVVGQNCGCSSMLCCGNFDYCGNDDFCGFECEPGPCISSASSSITVARIVTPAFFNGIINQVGNYCFGKSFYSRNAFLDALNSYPRFGRTGSQDDSKREIAAFFAHVTHETGHFCYKEEINGPSKNYCQANNREYPCVPGKGYYGRGPIQISWNYNYGPAGKAVGFDGLNNPDIVANNPVISFRTAFWFWMNNVHSIITSGQGFGPTIRAINGGECGGGNSGAVNARVNYYRQYCGQLGVAPGNNLYC